mgnify:CR=1 FL=1|tara:strand:+ start:205 stop:459 length:255 start_codon:yes stop_codon:yes gene_type:complete
MKIVKDFDKYALIELKTLNDFDMYAIDSIGNIWSKYRNNYIKQFITKKSGIVVFLKKDGKRHKLQVSKLLREFTSQRSIGHPEP